MRWLFLCKYGLSVRIGGWLCGEYWVICFEEGDSVVSLGWIVNCLGVRVWFWIGKG